MSKMQCLEQETSRAENSSMPVAVVTKNSYVSFITSEFNQNQFISLDLVSPVPKSLWFEQIWVII